ncbi:hypothetical protein LguiB_003192 [Lonicera macranthoides]
MKMDLKKKEHQNTAVIRSIQLYSLIGEAAEGRTSDWVGRRWTIVVAAGILPKNLSF